jgi:hypothetical protein
MGCEIPANLAARYSELFYTPENALYKNPEMEKLSFFFLRERERKERRRINYLRWPDDEEFPFHTGEMLQELFARDLSSSSPLHGKRG